MKRTRKSTTSAFRLKAGAPEHYSQGRFYKAGDTIPLAEGVNPGKWLEPLDPPKAAEETEADDPDKGEKAGKAGKPAK